MSCNLIHFVFSQEEAAKADEQKRFEAEKKRLMEMKVPEIPRTTHASMLKVEAVRRKQALKAKAEAKEKREAAARRQRLREAGEDLKPVLEAFDKEREPKPESFDDFDDGA